MMTEYAAARVGNRRVRETERGGNGAPRREASRGVRVALGKLYVTPGVLSTLVAHRDRDNSFSAQQGDVTGEPLALVLPFIGRHMSGDWGDVDPEDWRANDAALVTGERLLSAYSLTAVQQLWIITEADRSSTTVLLPSEY